jgi:hypothetical protein
MCIHIKTKELEITLSPLELTLKIKSYFIVLKGLLKEFDIFCSAIIRQNLRVFEELHVFLQTEEK